MRYSMDSGLIALPQEVIDLIVTDLADTATGEDVIALSLTCSYFFRLLSSRIQKLLEADAAPWVGDRLICVGDYARGIPDGVGSDDERKEWENLGNNPLYELGKQMVCEGVPKRLPIRAGILEIKCYVALDLYALERMESDVPEEEDLEDIDLCCRLMDMLKVQLPRKPEDGSRVLRNLTTHEYVVDEVVGKSEFAYSLGEVVMLLSLWTEDPSGVGDLDIHGKWAGHRFDIVSINDVADESWKDVTDTAIKVLEGTEYSRKDGRRAW